MLLALPYLGVVLGAKNSAWLQPEKLASMFRGAAPKRSYRVLDTSVIIDGRIADICETGFIDGTLVVPQFVLKELQLVADSSDSMKRNRGRRGLDILQKIQKMAGVDVIISDKDFPEVREVDLKLIELARTLGGKIVTNDFNLNKVAQLRGVEVLNINELANSLKPVVLPGEIMKVFILKEGKEYNQGVAYLDDGTMVVVDNARKLIGKTIDVVVTSVLQTTAGKMIFGRFIDSPSASSAPAQAPAAAQAAGLDALLIGVGSDLRYLTGYAAMPLERLTMLVVPAAGSPYEVAPRLELGAAQAVVRPPLDIRTWDETDQATFEHLWQLTGGRRLRKRRHLVPEGDLTWEVDEFTDRVLHLAELEIETATTAIRIPDWLKPVLVRDVTDEREYTNRNLAR